MANDFPTLEQLEQLCEGEALRLCASARTVESSIRLQLQGALAAIRSGDTEEAVALMERAIGIGERWTR